MHTILSILTIQVLLGALDNLWHHEITEKLPSKPGARNELILHAVREFLYAVIFILIGWYTMEGVWTWIFGALLLAEIIVTLTDFIVEDMTRKLPKLERVLHTVLAINFGAIMMLLLPMMAEWADRPTALMPADYGAFSWAMTVFAVGVFAWAMRDALAVVVLTVRRVPYWKRHPIRPGHRPDARTVLVAGGTGFVGTHLCRALIESGDRIIVLTRDRTRAEDVFGPHVRAIESTDELPDSQIIDAIVNLTGERIIGPLWTKRRKAVLLESRLKTTEVILRLIRRMAHKPEVLLSASAIGYYGIRGDEPLTEDAAPQDIFMSRMCQQREAITAQAETMGVRVCPLRFGLVFGRDGGAFPPLALPARFGLGAVMGSGRQWMSWIHIVDAVAAIRFLMETPEAEGPVNLTAPGSVRQREFITGLGKALRRPVWLRAPKFAIRTLLGEMGDIFVEGQRIVPGVLQQQGFTFTFPELPEALGDLLGQVKATPDNACATIYYNATCPVCRSEVQHYRNRALAENLPVEVADIAEYPQALLEFGLNDEDARERFYVLDGAGRLHGGVDAFIAVWSAIPAYRVFARLLRLPGVYLLVGALYEGIAAPLLYAWDRRRRARMENVRPLPKGREC